MSVCGDCVFSSGAVRMVSHLNMIRCNTAELDNYSIMKEEMFRGVMAYDR